MTASKHVTSSQLRKYYFQNSRVSYVNKMRQKVTYNCRNESKNSSEVCQRKSNQRGGVAHNCWGQLATSSLKKIVYKCQHQLLQPKI